MITSVPAACSVGGEPPDHTKDAGHDTANALPFVMMSANCVESCCAVMFAGVFAIAIVVACETVSKKTDAGALKSNVVVAPIVSVFAACRRTLRYVSMLPMSVSRNPPQTPLSRSEEHTFELQSRLH